MHLGDRIKTLRKERGLTMEELGSQVGVGKGTVYKWESGDIANMRRDKIARVAEALGVSPGYLMGWETREGKRVEDPNAEVWEYREAVRRNPKTKLLFSLAKDASTKDIDACIAMLQALKGAAADD